MPPSRDHALPPSRSVALTATALALTLALTGPAVAHAAEAAAPAAGVEVPVTGWQPLRFPSIDAATTYTPLADAPGWHAEASCAASALVHPLPHLDLAATPRLRWRWRALAAVDPPDERTRAGDDFAARVTVMFRRGSAHLSWVDRVTRTVREAAAGDPLPDRALTFVWAARLPRGASWPSPFETGRVRLSAETSGPPDGSWHRVEVDVRARVEAAFGSPAPPVLALAIMTDSDTVCGRAVAEYADFRWLPRSPAGTGADAPSLR